MGEMNFIHVDLPLSDQELFCGPLDPTEDFTVFDGASLADLLVVRMKKFPSLSQARKNGWDRPIPPGFAEHRIGKTKFWTLNRWELCDADA
jgi:hypothetical protein